jgi:hypothetical protein
MSSTKRPRKTAASKTKPISPKQNITIDTIEETTAVALTPEIAASISIEEPAEPAIENIVLSSAPNPNEYKETEEAVDSKLHKKRGRKPKGGKLIVKQNETSAKPQNISNIVLHLKCSLADIEEGNQYQPFVLDPLKYNPTVPPEIVSADCFSAHDLKPSLVDDAATENKKFAYFQEPLYESSIQSKNADEEEEDTPAVAPTYVRPNVELATTTATAQSEKNMMKEINTKLKKLKLKLYKNECSDKRAACFWCTYDFDSPPCYIPKYEMDQTLYGYGSFCRPECAAAYLMKENIDDSSKFERYYLLNQIYGKIFGYEKNIKLAPNPYYTLDKYYGSLTIQEYRKLLKLDHCLVVLEKPMTRVLPELHEDNDSVNLNTNTVNVNGNYKVKRQSEKQSGPSKSSIIRDCFNL